MQLHETLNFYESMHSCLHRINTWHSKACKRFLTNKYFQNKANKDHLKYQSIKENWDFKYDIGIYCTAGVFQDLLMVMNNCIQFSPTPPNSHCLHKDEVKHFETLV